MLNVCLRKLLHFVLKILLYLSISVRVAIGRFCGPYFTVKETKIWNALNRFTAVVLHADEIAG